LISITQNSEGHPGYNTPIVVFGVAQRDILSVVLPLAKSLEAICLDGVDGLLYFFTLLQYGWRRNWL
jgi:hypothetical protein